LRFLWRCHQTVGGGFDLTFRDGLADFERRTLEFDRRDIAIVVDDEAADGAGAVVD
jgi:hypothetical protein